MGAGGGGGGGEEATAAARQAAANAKIARMNSASMKVTMEMGRNELISNFQSFDMYSRQTQGTTALMLARAGMMTSRRTNKFYTREETGTPGGVDLGPASAIRRTLETMQGDLVGLQNKMTTITGALDRSRSQLSSDRARLAALRPSGDGGGEAEGVQVDRVDPTSSWDWGRGRREEREREEANERGEGPGQIDGSGGM